MTVIFVSGTIGSGKSQFCEALAELGAESVSADQIVADLYSDDEWCYSLEDFVQRSFRDTSGNFDKAALAAAAFSDEKLRDALEKFIHPQVRSKLKEVIAKSQSRVFVYEIPILRNDTDRSLADVVVRVDAPFALRLSRLISRGMSEADALARMKVQDDDKQRNVDVDVVVTNDGTAQQLHDQAVQLFEIWSKQ